MDIAAHLSPHCLELLGQHVIGLDRPRLCLTIPHHRAASRLTRLRVQTAAGFVLHVGSSTGSLSVGDEVTATIDDNRRARILPNHTFTHILNYALREV